MKAKEFRDKLSIISDDLNHGHLSYNEAVAKLNELGISHQQPSPSVDIGAKEWIKQNIPNVKDTQWNTDTGLTLSEVEVILNEFATTKREGMPTKDQIEKEAQTQAYHHLGLNDKTMCVWPIPANAPRNKSFYEGFKSCAEWFKGSGETKEGWISVEDELPELEGEDHGFVKCLISQDNGHVQEAMYNTRTERFQDKGFTGLVNKVTHWQPLPKPQKSKI